MSTYPSHAYIALFAAGKVAGPLESLLKLAAFDYVIAQLRGAGPVLALGGTVRDLLLELRAEELPVGHGDDDA